MKLIDHESQNATVGVWFAIRSPGSMTTGTYKLVVRDAECSPEWRTNGPLVPCRHVEAAICLLGFVLRFEVCISLRAPVGDLFLEFTNHEFYEHE